MSQNEEAKKNELSHVTDELANQPKQDGEGTEESKDRRGSSEKKVNEHKSSPAETK